MARIAGVDLPRTKRVEVGLTYIYGIGRKRSNDILTEAQVSPDIRVKDLSEEDVRKISRVIEEQAGVEGLEAVPLLERVLDRAPGHEVLVATGAVGHGRCRPVSIHNVKATVANGDVVSFEHRMAGSELDLRHGLGDVVSGYVTEYNNEGASQSFFTHTQKLAYKFGPTALTLKQRLLAKATAPWRVVYSGPVGGSNEILIDELARSLGKDEFEFRMANLESDRHRAVLEKAAHEAQWGKKLPNGVAQGISCAS